MSDIAVTSESPSRSPLADEVARRRTFAIISHPDAGKTTLTEKLLLFGGAINLAGRDAAAAKTLDHFISWLARLSSDAAMALQARGGVYLAGGIAPSIIASLKSGPFRSIFEDKGKLAHLMHPIPVYVIVDRFPAFKGCAASLAQ